MIFKLRNISPSNLPINNTYDVFNPNLTKWRKKCDDANLLDFVFAVPSILVDLMYHA